MRDEQMIRLNRDELEHMAKMVCSSDVYYELVDIISEVDDLDLIDIINGKKQNVIERYKEGQDDSI